MLDLAEFGSFAHKCIVFQAMNLLNYKIYMDQPIPCGESFISFIMCDALEAIEGFSYEYCMSRVLKVLRYCSSSPETQFYFRDKNCCHLMVSIPFSILCHANKLLCYWNFRFLANFYLEEVVVTGCNLSS